MRAFQGSLLLALSGCCAIATSGEPNEATSREASQIEAPAATSLDDGHAIVQGVVVDARQEPISAVAVSAVFLSHREATDPLAGSTVAIEGGHTMTDASGRFRMSIRRTTSQDIALELSAYVTGYGVALLDLGFGKINHDVTLALPKETSVATVVLAPNGEPLAGAAIKLRQMLAAVNTNKPAWYSAPSTGVTAWPGPYMTRRDGSFTLIGGGSIEKMQLEIDDERVARQRWIVATGKDTDALILRTEAPRYVVGEVVAGDSRTPLADTTVVLTSLEDNEFIGNLATKTDANGRFALRPFVGNNLEIRAVAEGVRYKPLRRHIPWLDGTTRQRMVLPIFGPGFDRVDGTTFDGRLAGTINADYPITQPVLHRPAQPLAAQLSGTIVAEASLTTHDSDPAAAVFGLIAIDPATGRWRLLAENGRSPRVSPDGKHLLFSSSDNARHLQIVELKPLVKPRQIDSKCDGPASWMPTSDAFIANINNPTPHDYYGEEYWATESEKWRFELTGNRLGTINVPPRYDVFDVSPDGRLLAMHWDTHAGLTGAQLYTAQVDGSELEPIARKRFQYYWYPRFSPDGKTVLAKHLDAQGGQVSVHTLALDGSVEHSISLDGFGPEIACWSPDGKCIAIAAYQEAAFSGGRKLTKLFIVDSLGIQIKEVVLANADELRIVSIDWTAESLLIK